MVSAVMQCIIRIRKNKTKKTQLYFVYGQLGAVQGIIHKGGKQKG